jgi:hypothetical protein
LSDEKIDKPVLILHGSMVMADLTFSDFSISFKTKFTENKANLTPYRITDRKGIEIDKDISLDFIKKSLTDIIENE